MPELPEVETVKNYLVDNLCGKLITNTVVRNGALRWPVTQNLAYKLISRQIQNITRRGKYIIISLDAGYLLIHLGMSGVLTIVNQDVPLKKHDHIDVCFDDGFCLRFNDPRRFGCFLWLEHNPLQHKLLKSLGVEPLTQEFSAAYLFELTQKTQRPIKLLLMDSNLIVGVGNIYANEVLFITQIHPKTKACKLTKKQCADLVCSIKDVLKAAIKAGGTSFKDYRKADGKLGYFQQELLVYGRGGGECKKCGDILESFYLGQRKTVCCPNCQKGDS
jgi:formamidopyrimidine-DNA glycosylase